jgi:phenylalanyl-tRNA synthetase beta chain
MKFTLSWLKDHLETDATLGEIVEKLTAIGLEVEEVDDKAAFKPFVIAKVLTAEQHPGGAPNARAGLDRRARRAGHLCSGHRRDARRRQDSRRREPRHDVLGERIARCPTITTGIIDLPEDAPVGTSFAAYAGLDDPVIEINLTPERVRIAPAMYGIARDLAAAGLGTLKSPQCPTLRRTKARPHRTSR